jgi:RNA polymerase sigma-70 factor (ECF subfamily)
MEVQTVRDDIVLSKTGDTHAFGRVVRATQGFVFRVSFRLLCDEEEARDVVQETFVRAWQSLQTYDPSRKFTTWIYAIAVNLCYDRIRTKRRRELVLSRANPGSSTGEPLDHRPPDERYSNQEIAVIIRDLADGLPPKQRLTFTLRDIEDLSIQEVVGITGMSTASVKTNLHYARRAIRKILEKRYGV